MLKHLSIKDFAVVRQTELEFGPGMTVVSGETGAGKSLMVDALTLLAGARADSGMVRHGSERAELAAEFQLSGASPALEWLRSNELDEDSSHCQLRRVIRADGGMGNCPEYRLRLLEHERRNIAAERAGKAGPIPFR